MSFPASYAGDFQTNLSNSPVGIGHSPETMQDIVPGLSFLPDKGLQRVSPLVSTIGVFPPVENRAPNSARIPIEQTNNPVL
jgi:hypothetical protein